MPEQLERRLGVAGATAVNVLAMIGVGPFITIPLMLRAMGGPLAMLGWFVGAIVALADGLVWAELGAAMPRSGGGYQYLLEAFGPAGPGRMLSFLYLWEIVIGTPLLMASGAVGFANYATFLYPAMTPWQAKGVAMAVSALAAAAIYRRIDRIGRWSIVLGVVTLLTGAWIVGEGALRGSISLIAVPPGAWQLSRGFLMGLGGATLFAVYDYFGYNTIGGVGGEVIDPAVTIPRSIIGAIVLVWGLYVSMNLSIISVVPWRDAMASPFIVSDFIARLHRGPAAAVMTMLILAIAASSLCANMLGASRVPYAAALDGRFFRLFAHVHPTRQFPTFSVVYLGVASAACCLLELDALINALTVLFLIVAAIPIVAASVAMRRIRPDLARPFRMWLYPLPSLIAFTGWIFIIVTSGWIYIASGLSVLAVGIAAYLWRARRAGEWPFEKELQ